MKKTIALVTGGFTGEAVISLKSAAVVEKNLDLNLYNVYKIVISRDGWYYEDASGKRFFVDKNDFSISFEGKRIKFDGVFNILHGSPGEDGKLAGYFDLLGLPYTTCDVLTSALTMNKDYTKTIVNGIEGLKVAKSFHLFKNDTNSIDRILKTLQLPLFIKPNNGGSSIGMTKVKSVGELEPALERAFNEDQQVLVEEFVTGREFSIGAFQVGETVTVLPSTEIISSKEFFDFEAKYIPGVAEEITPGRLTEEEVGKINRIVAAVYRKLNCKGAVRVDYFLEATTSDFYFIEINTVPGQTETSLINQQVKASGMTVKDFYTLLIEEMFVAGREK